MTSEWDEGEDVVKRGEALYQNVLREQGETEENIGKIISMDVVSGEYEIDEDPLQAGLRMQARHPGFSIYAKRIGYNAVYAVGGSIYRVTHD